MKKVLGFFAALTLTSGLAYAEGVAFGNTTDGGGSGTITTANCALLASSVQLNLSANVFGGYSCNVANASIKVATCHRAGSRAEIQAQCVEDTSTTPSTWNLEGCGPETATVPVADFKGYTASSTGGSVAVADLGTNCTSASLIALDHFTD